MAEVSVSSTNNTNSKPTTKRRVHFDPKLVTLTKEAPVYDRTAAEIDLFSCDVCGIQIPAGMKGFEPYGTCEVCCEDGFDACGACCGTQAIMKICASHVFSPNTAPPTMQVACHKHPLTVVDRKAEIQWANDSNDNTTSTAQLDQGKSPEKKKKQSPKRSGAKRSPKSASKSPRKKQTKG